MKKITDPSKLLPAAKSAAVSRKSRPKDSLVKQSTALVKRETNALAKSQSAAIVKKERKDIEYVNVRLLAIDNLFRNDFINSRREAEQRRRRTEEQDFTEAEKKIETPKSRKFKLGGKGDSPSLGFFDRVKRFLFFTALGWLVPKLIEFLPKLTGIVKTIGTVYKFAEGLFGKLFDGFMTLVKFGGDVKKQTLGFIATMKGGDYQTEFNKLEKTFDTFVNASIIAGVLAADIGFAAVDEYNKWRRKNELLSGAGQLGARYIGRRLTPKELKDLGIKPGSVEARSIQKSGAKAEREALKQKRKVEGAKIRAGLKQPEPSRPGKVPSWWNRIFKGPFAKLKGPLAKFAGTAVPGLGAVVGAADATARFKAGDNIGGALASVSAGLDTITAILAATGVGLPAAAVFGTVSIGIDVILLIRDIAKAVFPAIPMFNKGGRVVNRYQNGGTAKSTGTSRRAPRTPIRRPIRTKPPETKPGRDVGGENKIKQYYAKDSATNANQSPFFGLSFLSTPEDKNKNKPFETLKKTSKILKELPFGLGYFAGGAIDIALGQSMDVKKGLNQLSSGVAYMVDTLANQRVNMSMSALTRDLNAFAEGGFVPPNRQLRDPYAAVNSKDLIAKVLGPTIDQKVNEAIQSIEKDLRSIQQKKEEAPSAGGAGGLGGGVGPAIESIDVSGMSADDVDALGRMIAAEAAGENDLGKASVLATILNRYRLIKSGKASPSQFNIRGKTKDEVTIRDILFAGGQFSPYANGSFARTSSSSGKSALASAIRANGNDPEKLRENLVKSGLSEQDADYVVRSVAFSNAQERGSRPFPTREVTVGRHSFQQSTDVRLTGPIGRMDASIKEYESGGFPQNISTEKARRLIVMSGGRGYRQVMLGESAPTDYLHHGREDLRRGLIVRDYGITPQVHGGSQMLEGEGAPLVVPFGMRGKAIIEGRHAIRFEDPRTGAILARYHHVENIPSGINGKVIGGGTFFGIQGGKPGASSSYGSSTAVHTHLEGTADWHRAFINTYAGGLNVERTDIGKQVQKREQRSSREREYDVIIPLDHHSGRLPDKSLWPNASLGASGRERQAQGPTAEIMKRRLEAKGLRVKILRPEDYRTETDYNKALIRYSKSGAVVASLHYDAPRSSGGIGFLARLGSSPDKADRDYANKLAPTLQKMAREARGDQGYGGIDTASNITMRLSGPATAALIELGSLEEQERIYGKNFWTNPKFIKHLNEITDSTASSVQKEDKPQTTAKGMQQGGLIRPRGTQLPLTNSFASYENPTASPMIAIQPIIIEKPSYTAGNRAIAFPVPVSLNNDKSSFLSRG